MGYNLLVFASSSERLAFVSFVLDYYAHGQRLVGYLEDIKSLGGSSPAFFPKIGTPHGTSWVHLLGFSFLRRKWDYQVGRNGKTLSTTFTKSHSSFCRKVDTGYPLSSWLDNDKGGLATSVMPLRLPYCNARHEESKKKKLLCFRNHACGGYRGKDL
jgi:hypothetical protein